jgi:hypothetical protein
MNFDKTHIEEEEEEEMPKYTCEKCAHIFSQKSHYTAHQNKKIDCSSTTAIKSVVQKLADDEKNITVYKDWIQSKTFQHLSVGSANEVIYYFAESNKKLSNVSYDKIRKLSLFNVDVLNVDESNNSYYFNVPFDSRFDADIIDNISVSSTNDKMTATIILNGIEYELDKISEFVTVAMPYVQMTFKISFSEKPFIGDEVIIKSRNYMLSSEDRKFCLSTIKTDMFTYEGGNVYYKGPMEYCIVKQTKNSQEILK